MKRIASESQFFTPGWAASLLVSRLFPEINGSSRVIEPTCGDGRFLMALPSEAQAIGIEKDAELAEIARANTGREIVASDFRDVSLPFQATHIIGNPPFDASLFDQLLSVAFENMDYGGRAGFLLPAYFFQTASRTLRYMERWSLTQTMVPRNLFQDITTPLVFATFDKERKRASIGFLLYEETHAVRQLSKRYRFLFIGNESRASAWGEAVEQALVNLGGQASTQEIYREIEGRRPYRENEFWKAQIRKVLQKCAVRVRKGVWALTKQEDFFDQDAVA